MQEIPFTQANLLRCFRYQDLDESPALRIRGEREKVAIETARRIAQRVAFNSPLFAITAKGKSAWTFGDIHQALTCRLIAKNIERNYNIKPTGRAEIIKNLICYLGESYPIRLERLDIQSFFEEVNRDNIVPTILDEGKCSHHTSILLYDFFKLLDSHNIKGLPRGLSISSTLAELVVHHFDHTVRNDPNVFFYSRFVDDILIGTSDSSTVTTQLDELFKTLPKPLRVHEKGEKRQRLLAKKTSSSGAPSHLDYLGYRFEVHNNVHPTENILKNPRREIKIAISKGKVEKIKKRLLLSFSSFLSSSRGLTDFELLADRLKFLTGNYHITDPFTGVKIKSGIYYNYPAKNKFVRCELRELDALLSGILFSKKNHQLSRRVQASISSAQRERLKGFSFTYGFHQRRFYSLTHTRLSEIKECWPQ